MGEHGDMAFVYRLEGLIAEHSVRLFKSQHPEMVDELQYAYTFCLFGCIGMIKNGWMKTQIRRWKRWRRLPIISSEG